MNWLRQFMTGRNGPDTLSNYSMWSGFICSVLASVFRIRLLSYVAWVLLFYAMFRLFSKNVYQRRAENMKFFHTIQRLKAPIFKAKRKYDQRKYYKFYKCSVCKQELRVPKGKGNIKITCPKCKNSFTAKS